MERARIIKPEFWNDNKVAELPIGCRLFFIGSWCLADDNGVILGDKTYLKSKIFPFDKDVSTKNIANYIADLVKLNMFIIFAFENKEYYIIRTFHVHQKLDKKHPYYIVDDVVIKTFLIDNGYLKVKEPIDGYPEWYTDFDVYLKDLRTAYVAIINDKEYMTERASFCNKNLDIKATLTKACKDFWATKEGWVHKRKALKKNGGKINWKTTFSKALGQEWNKVWLDKDEVNPLRQEKKYI